MTTFIRVIARLVLAAVAVALPLSAMAQGEPIGIVIMHGKGGSPTKFVADLARTLEEKGYFVANLEMPWSGRLSYSVPVSRAEEEIEAAVASLRGKGAKRVFVSGHSQGWAFALHIAGKHSVRDYPGLLKTTLPMFRELPANPLTKLYEPSSDHLGAPSASAEEIVRWTREVAGAPKR